MFKLYPVCALSRGSSAIRISIPKGSRGASGRPKKVGSTATAIRPPSSGGIGKIEDGQYRVEDRGVLQVQRHELHACGWKIWDEVKGEGSEERQADVHQWSRCCDDRHPEPRVAQRSEVDRHCMKGRRALPSEDL